MDRRLFATSAAAFTLMPSRFVLAQPRAAWQDDARSLTDMPGVRVGHFTDSRRLTGCTVVMTEDGAMGGVDVRGSAPSRSWRAVVRAVRAAQGIEGTLVIGFTSSAAAHPLIPRIIRAYRERPVPLTSGKPAARAPKASAEARPGKRAVDALWDYLVATQPPA